MGRSTSKRRQMQLLAQENSRARMVGAIRPLSNAREMIENIMRRAPELTDLCLSALAEVGVTESYIRREWQAEGKETVNNCACLEYAGDNPNCPVEEHRNMYADFRQREKEQREAEINETARSLDLDFAAEYRDNEPFNIREHVGV